MTDYIFWQVRKALPASLRSPIMEKYIILSHYTAETVRDPREFPKLAHQVSARLKSECPNVIWKDSYATMGYFDTVDIVEAPSPMDVEKAALVIRSFGHADTQTLPAIPWKDFLQTLQS
jgi:uncharacterized protein with GYD domain